MSNWTEKHIRGLLHDNRIKGYQAKVKAKGYSADKNNTVPEKKSKALVWLDLNLLYWCNQRSLTLENQYKFCERGWKSDWAIPSLKILLEYEGGIFMQRSGHNSHTGMQRDIDKYTRAQVLGWQVIRVTYKNYTTVLKTLNELVK